MVRFMFVCKSPEDAKVYQARLEKATHGNPGVHIYNYLDVDNDVCGVCVDLNPVYSLSDQDTSEPIIKWLLPVDDPNY